MSTIITNPITNKAAFRRFLARTSTQRCAVGFIGDSNMRQNGFGWYGGFQLALSSFFPVWGTGCVSINENNGDSYGTPWMYRNSAAFGTWGGNLVANGENRAGAGNYALTTNFNNATLDALLPTFGDGRGTFTWGNNYGGSTQTATSYTAGVGNGLSLRGRFGSTQEQLNDHPLDRRGPLRATVCYANFGPASTGTFRLAFHLGGAGNSSPTAQSATITTTGTANTVSWASVTLAADNNRNADPISTYIMNDATVPLNTPFWFSFFQIDNTSINTGVACTQIAARGGESAFDAYTWLNGKQVSLQHILRNMVQLDGVPDSSATALVIINEGANDFVEVGTSIDGINSNNSRQGFRANMAGIVSLLRTAWVAEGFDVNNLYIALMVTHPAARLTSDPTNGAREARLEEYRQEMQSLANSDSNLIAFNLRAVWGYNLPQWADPSNNYQRPTGQSGPDINHLNASGYITMATRLLNAAVYENAEQGAAGRVLRTGRGIPS